ncbi:MAG TPA: DUF3043 domain-containing protein [Natronosporangium sp.]|nr:DUF3043 domain-containing protein [Natronosporangium sp.]
MPQLFRRRSSGLAEAAPEAETPAGETTQGQAAAQTGPAGEGVGAQVPPKRPKGYTPSKKELGVVTPKRPSPHVRRPGATPVPRSRKQMTKEERRELREQRRARRREITEGMRQGDPRYLPARDQGPERALTRDVVDSRRNVGSWFFAGALVVLFLSSTALPGLVLLGNLMFLLLMVTLTVDSVLLCRKIKRLVRQRHPNSDVKLGSLYLYAVMRAVTFRRMRIPLPRKKIGDPV